MQVQLCGYNPEVEQRAYVAGLENRPLPGSPVIRDPIFDVQPFLDLRAGRVIERDRHWILRCADKFGGVR